MGQTKFYISFDPQVFHINSPMFQWWLSGPGVGPETYPPPQEVQEQMLSTPWDSKFLQTDSGLFVNFSVRIKFVFNPYYSCHFILLLTNLYRMSLNSVKTCSGISSGLKKNQSIMFITSKSPSLSVQPPLCPIFTF